MPARAWLTALADRQTRQRNAECLQNQKSVEGRVSRASPGVPALRNCTRDEGGPFGFGNQVSISSHRKPLRAKALVVSVAETPGLDLPRFRGEMRAWDQALWLSIMLSSGSWYSLVRPPAEPFFRPDPRTDSAAARSGGQGRPLSAAARRACP